jgi:SAM-dependent methyltransferase
MSQSPYSAVDDSPDPASLVTFLDRAADGLGAMKRYVAHRMSQLAPGRLVLDLGCGAGHDLPLLEEVGLSGVGLDASAVMLAEAGSRNLPRLVRGAGEALPFRGESFDGCRIERVLMHVADPASVITDVARVLRPGGVVAIFEPDWSSVWFESTTPDAALVMGHLSPCRWPDVGARLAGLVTDAGFTIIDEVTEASWGSRLALIPLDVEGRVQRRVADGSIPADVARAWLGEQRERDRSGHLRARWVKQLVVAQLP